MNSSSEDLERLIREWSAMPPPDPIEKGGFDVFKILGLSTREIYHSRFLAYLLNPKGDHGLHDGFLRRVLSSAGIDWQLDDFTSNVEVEVEVPLEEHGRIDIKVQWPDRTLLIENKVYSAESDDQVKGYRTWLKEKDSNGEIIFLTPQEAECSDTAARKITYAQVAESLRKCLLSEHNPKASHVLAQYSVLCKAISENKVDNESNELTDNERKLFSEPANVFAIFSVEPKIETLRVHLLKEFWEVVIQELRNKLEQRTTSWIADFGNESRNPRESRARIGIYWGKRLTREPNANCSPYYQVEVECVGGRPECAFWGISRSHHVRRENVTAEDKELVRLLHNADKRLKDSEWWAGWKPLELGGLPFNVDNPELMKKLAGIQFTNLNADSFPVQTATMIFDLFSRYEEKLTGLNRSSEQ